MVVLYVTCFGFMLCCFEMRVGRAEQSIRNNCGFMYTYLGRTIFLVFVGTWCFGIVSNNSSVKSLAYAAGIFTAVNAVFNCAIISKHSEMSLRGDPSAGYTTAGAEAKAAAARNPELTKKAVGTAANYARENPQMVVQAASAYSQSQQGGGGGGNDNPFDMA